MLNKNARAFLPFGIAIAALIIATATKNDSIVTSKRFLSQLALATTCFVFVLIIIWMPKDSGKPIRILRDVKTSALTLGGITVIALVNEFISKHVK